jgi:hypothetical protein
VNGKEVPFPNRWQREFVLFIVDSVPAHPLLDRVG